MSEFRSNPKLYRELSEPFASVEAAEEAANGFMKEIADIRTKYRMRDVYVALGFSHTNIATGEECGAIVSGGLGDAFQWEVLLAHALGQEQADRQQRVGALLGRALTRKREK